MNISESHNERMEHQEDEQTDIDIITLITKNSVVTGMYLMTGDVHSQGVPKF